MVSFFQHNPWVLLVAQHDSWLVVRPGVVSRASEARTRNRLTEQLDQSVEKGGTRLSGTFKKIGCSSETLALPFAIIPVLLYGK